MGKLLKSSKFWLAVILVLALIIRFYRLPEYIQFLGDEGRDVLIVKRMIVDHRWTLLGPNASVGGFYTGPVYYYFMIPFLWLFQLDPVGPAVMSVFFGLATICLFYFFGKEFFDERTGVIMAFIAAISPKMILLSRSSWNPNPVPFFSLLAVYFLYLAAKKNKNWPMLLCGVFLGIAVQLHYTALALIPILSLPILFIFSKKSIPLKIFYLIIGFVVGDSLFLFFEIRHGFPNIRSVLEFVNRGGSTISPRSFNPVFLFTDMTRRVYEIVFAQSGTVLIIICLVSVVLFIYWFIQAIRDPENRSKAIILTSWYAVGILAIGSYRGQLLDHYFGYLYPLPFIFVGISLYLIRKWKFSLFASLAVLILFIWLEVPKMYFWEPPNNLLLQTQDVDKIVLDSAADQPYNFALISTHNSDQAYRYYLEIWGKTPLTLENPEVDPGRKSIAGQLIVVCEDPKCQPLGNPTWEVAGFGRAEIADKRIGPAGILIYKLVHYTGT